LTLILLADETKGEASRNKRTGEKPSGDCEEDDREQTVFSELLVESLVVNKIL
jgi:hypothetical protein